MKTQYRLLWSAAAVAAACGMYGCTADGPTHAMAGQAAADRAVANIDTVVVIYAENRSFDNLYSDFPGVDNPLASATFAKQLDRDGKTVLPKLPVVWTGLTAQGQSQFDNRVVQVTADQTDGMENAPFSINGQYHADINAVTRDLWHNFYQNQMQIDGGKNDLFAAWADSGGLVMGQYTGNGAKLPLWKVAQKYTMADHFFMGAFGGSFLNHQYLIASTAPTDPLNSVNASLKAALDDGDQGYRLAVKPANIKGGKIDSAIAVSAQNIFVNFGNITPDGYAINTMQPPYQPSSNAPAASALGNERLLADPGKATTLPPQTSDTIGDYLTRRNVEWAWYAGGWGFQSARSIAAGGWQGSDYVGGKALKPGSDTPFVNFQFHHQPFNYFKRFDPTTPEGQAERAEHLKDAGVQGEKFVDDIRAGKLPPVTFYKPVGNLNEHAGYADVQRGDQHIADVIAELEKSPQWGHMLVVVTYDENGGYWDHVAPPKGDRFGPGSRIPTLLIGPTVRKGYVDHTMYDTTSILRFITRRWNLPELPGLAVRREKLKENSGVEQGDLSGALTAAAS